MDKHAQQLVRLAELMNISAGVLRDLMDERDFDGETDNLMHIASELERMSAEVKKVGFSGLPL